MKVRFWHCFVLILQSFWGLIYWFPTNRYLYLLFLKLFTRFLLTGSAKIPMRLLGPSCYGHWIAFLPTWHTSRQDLRAQRKEGSQHLQSLRLITIILFCFFPQLNIAWCLLLSAFIYIFLQDNQVQYWWWMHMWAYVLLYCCGFFETVFEAMTRNMRKAGILILFLCTTLSTLPFLHCQ